MTSSQQLDDLLQLLKLEKDAEIFLHQDLLLRKSIIQRVADGATWYPCVVESHGYGLGEYPYIIVERTKNLDLPHKLRAGQVVEVFTGNPKREAEERGVISFVERNKMKVVFYCDDLPAWVHDGKIGVDLSFDERSYREMEKAIAQVKNAKNNRLAELRETLFGALTPRFETIADEVVNLPMLNHSQREAVKHILGTVDVSVVHGPPGTGKTTTLVEAIRLLSHKENNILVCAPSNPATDLIAEKLSARGINVLRIGHVSRVDENLFKLTLEGKMSERPEMVEVKKMKQEAANLRKKADQFKRKFGHEEREERRMARQEARQVVHHARMLEDYVIDKIISEAQVICCTLVGAVDKHIEKRNFKWVFIDEAAQALEPATWIPINKADRVIFAGDPFQLPPTVKNHEAAKKGYSITLIEKLLDRLPEVKLLDVQYRMNELIMGFSNEQFYEGRLQAHESVETHSIQLSGQYEDPIEFVDTAGCGFEEKENPETKSRYNEGEYLIIRKHLDDLLTRADENYSIGILSPYKEQVEYISRQLKHDLDHFPNANITIDTVDSFQGQERDVMYISLVRSNTENQIGFLSDTRRMNVAMTRARKKLVVIGDSATLGGSPFYDAMLNYFEKHLAYKTAWEFNVI
jgi:superfamily I DNA and/or RNA helicase